MRIAIACPYDIHTPGGVQTHILDLSKELRENGHYVKIIAPRCDKKQKDNKDVIFVGKSKKIEFNKTIFDVSLAYGKERKKLSAALRDGNFDVIHYHTIWTPFLLLQILFASKAANVATFHDTPPDNLSGKITKFVFRLLSYFLLKHLDAAIAVSEAPAEHLVKLSGHKIHIVPPCTDLRFFSPSVRPLVSGLENVVTILFLGRLEKRKGILLLMQAFNKLHEQKLDVRLIIAGDGKEETNIRKYIDKHNLSRVMLLGRIPETDKAACYNSCDIFCSPALYGESFGIVLVEAMASGRPVVAAANKGYKKVLQSKADLCLANPGDPEDLYCKLHNLVINRKLREELGQWGVSEAKKYQCGSLVAQYIDIYKNALALKR